MIIKIIIIVIIYLNYRDSVTKLFLIFADDYY